MNPLSSYRVGDRVYFGRSHGEQTLGEVVRVNRVKLKVRQLDSRGTYRSYPVGTVWTVPVALCTPANGEAVPVMAPEVQARLKAGQDRDYDFMRGFLPGPGKTEPSRPMPKRAEAEIKREILGIYCSLSPENLTCDGELSRTQVARRASALNARLRACFKELGREVSEGEAYGMVG